MQHQKKCAIKRIVGIKHIKKLIYEKIMELNNPIPKSIKMSSKISSMARPIFSQFTGSSEQNYCFLLLKNKCGGILYPPMRRH